MDRRTFGSLMGGAVSLLLLESLFTRDAFAGTRIQDATDAWLKDLLEMSIDLRATEIPPRVWQDRIAELFDRVPLDDLLAAVDFERQARALVLPDKGVSTSVVRFPTLSGLRGGTCVGKIFGMQRDRAIIPHGHRNMTSCHVVLEGELHLRQFERMADDGESMILEPTIDEVVGPGTHSSISDERNNVHWLVARSDRAFTFDVIVLDLGGARTLVENLDPAERESMPGGRFRVPKLPVHEALEKYGHVTHHQS